MKIIIFGAGGGIGKHAVTHALNKGYEVTAYLRNPEKLTARAENLTVVKGEITDYAWMKIAISGCDAVVWCIGVNGDGAALAGRLNRILSGYGVSVFRKSWAMRCSIN